MNKYVSRGLWFTLFLGGLSLAGIGVANAAETSGSDGTASGNQAAVDLTVPVTLGGNGISVLGDSQSSGATTSAGSTAAPASPAPATPAPAVSTSGLGGVVSGDQALVDVSAPVVVSGNSISAVGDSSSDGSGTAASAGGSAPAAAAAPTTSGSDGVASGIQAPVGAAVPVTAGGNAVSVLGDSSSSGATTSAPAAASSSGGALATTGENGVASGIQAPVGAAVPVTAGGNAVSVLGDSSSTGSSSSGSSSGGSTVTGGTGTGGTPGDGSGSTTSGSGGILSGAQLPIALGVPVIARGNAVRVVGDASTQSSAATPAAPTTPTTPTTPGDPISVDPESSTGTGSGPGTGTGTGVLTATAGVGAAVALGAGSTADLGASALATTGSDTADLAGFGAIAALLALAGVVLLFGSRNRETKQVRAARHQRRTQ